MYFIKVVHYVNEDKNVSFFKVLQFVFIRVKVGIPVCFTSSWNFEIKLCKVT